MGKFSQERRACSATFLLGFVARPESKRETNYQHSIEINLPYRLYISAHESIQKMNLVIIFYNTIDRFAYVRLAMPTGTLCLSTIGESIIVNS